ncbi:MULTISPECIES: MFS transporter [Streptomyces]|uniref:MFS transporter n=1 Tax=unclassified Streptomyces TaxID=2593676 RepID=UPI00087E9B33|nr:MULTISPECIES: MFS transporter [unclassified Streptomyces]MDX2731631.1 MFS transporter [Streptomyces sp. PA03-2a]MDX3771120.1 MFS transporter [Streptomyces sp. AK08-01B]MDX3820653.1 MFS transporter [Streptomyces sp. AK08-01A]SCZ16259.1 Major Facilitator Superfamily protein [Streptomyces sp. 136MFCol5.1]
MDSPQPAARSGGVVGILAFAGIVAAITQTLVVPLIAELPKLLDTSASNASWVITATLLAAAVTTPVAGRLGDMYGKRRMLLTSLIPLIAGSVVCALSSSVVPMIAGRGLQGLGMGVVPLGISLLRDVVPAEKLGSSIAIMSASMGVGGALGLPFAAAIAENSSWRVLFWVVAALALAVGTLIWVFVPGDRENNASGGFDLLGAIGLGSALICLLLAVSKGADWGWGSGTTLGLFAAAVIVLLVWGRWELRISDPLVDLRVTARPQVLMTNAASILVGFAMYAQSLVVPQLLQLPEATGYGLGQSMLAMGLWMAPAGLMMMIMSPIGAKLSAAKGPKVTLAVGSLIIGIGYGISLPLISSGSTWSLLAVTIVCNTGVGFAYGAMPALIMGAVPQSETASANSFNTLMRSIGSSVSAAVIGVVLAQLTTDFGGYALPSENGFRIAMLIGCGVGLAAAVVASLIPVRAAAQPGSTVSQHPASEATEAEVKA